ncbi:MAG: hypothetical protein PHQ32_06275 [Firmicutes bacterium]|nr:hypothetical protein [Bacillota bacterium]
MMKKVPIIKLIIAVLLILTLIVSFGLLKVYGKNNLSVENAEIRANAFAEAVNYDYKDPSKIYAFMTAEYKGKITSDEFVKAFNKERSYPYLCPLFINLDKVELTGKLTEGTAIYSQAARLPGMIYNVKLIYENSNYYIVAFEEFIDGSYLEKFENLSYSLDSYFDFNK